MPFDDTHRRIVESLRRRIEASALSFSFTRSSGPGGQNVNKVNTRATLWFDLEGDSALTSAEKSTIRERLGGRLSRDGRLHVASMRFRTQRANREAATERFFDLLAEAIRPRTPRRPTRSPRSAKERRIREKKRTGERKRMRSGGTIPGWHFLDGCTGR